jgi:hypothetical protein
MLNIFSKIAVTEPMVTDTFQSFKTTTTTTPSPEETTTS